MRHEIQQANRLMKNIGYGAEFELFLRLKGLWDQVELSDAAKALHLIMFQGGPSWSPGHRPLTRRGAVAMEELLENGYVFLDPVGIYRKMLEVEVEDEMTLVVSEGWGFWYEK